ncbi:MAG: DUF2169 domain-containing protein [Polyangiaceae bacterium]
MNHAASVSIQGPVSADVIKWRAGGKLRVTVIAKACLEFAGSGRVSLVEPPPIYVKDRWAGGGTELLSTSDLAPFVPAAEVLIVGRAPHRQARARVGFRLERGPVTLIDKSIDTSANEWLAELGPRPTTAWPYPPETIQAEAVPLDGVDGARFQRAAVDQRTNEVRGGEELVLVGLVPNAAVLRFPLFPPTIEAFITCGGARDPVAMRIDGVLVTLADRRCSLLYRGSLPLRAIVGEVGVHVFARPDERALQALANSTRTPNSPSGAGVLQTITLDDVQGNSSMTMMSDDVADDERGSAIPFSPVPRSPQNSPSRPQVAATPWASEPMRAVQPASIAMTTLPTEDEEEEPAPQAPTAPRFDDEPTKESAGLFPTPKSAGSPWRADPPEQPAPPVESPAAPKVAKKDLNAQLYRRPKR